MSVNLSYGIFQWKYYSGARVKCWVLLFAIFTYLCVLCAAEEMPLWELIAAIRLLIQLIAALGCSFSLCSSQRSLSRDFCKAVSFKKTKKSSKHYQGYYFLSVCREQKHQRNSWIHNLQHIQKRHKFCKLLYN